MTRCGREVVVKTQTMSSNFKTRLGYGHIATDSIGVALHPELKLQSKKLFA